MKVLKPLFVMTSLFLLFSAGACSHAFASFRGLERGAIDSELIDRAAEAFSIKGSVKNVASLYQVGEYALAVRVHLIRSARKTIDIQTFIWSDDIVTRFLFSELVGAAERGVKVRLLVDHMTPFGKSVEPLAAMVRAHGNIEIRYFKPISRDAINGPGVVASVALSDFSRVNRRMHNKLFVVDDCVSILGGRNYQTVYYDLGSEFNFKDRDVVLCGPVVTKIKESFATYWMHPHSFPAIDFDDVAETLKSWDGLGWRRLLTYDRDVFRDVLKLSNCYSIASEVDDGRLFEVGDVEYICDPPVMPSKAQINNDPGHWLSLGTELRKAEDYIVAQSPYLVASKRTKDLVGEILKKNPDLEIHFSTNSLAAADHVIVASVSLKQQRKQLRRLKYRIYQFKPYPRDMDTFIPGVNQIVSSADEDIWGSANLPRASLHAKSLVIDGKVSVVCSSNFDPRSAYLNSECAVIIRDTAFAEELESNIRRDMDPCNSWIVAERKPFPLIGQINNFMSSVSNMLPVLDVWPNSQTSCFELKEGSEAVSSSHPEFYKRYRKVGLFPECGDSTIVFQTQFLKALFGWATPIM